MFSVNDFFKILSYLKGDTVENLDEVLQILSKSEQATSSQYFQNIIDQNAHMSPDYLRLRNLLIDWYASHKTILGVQKKVSDVFSIPDDHIDELIRSFGFDGPIEELTRNNKINFFYDLVNLYKIKGSPESIIKALSYFGLSNVDIVEYWLQKNEAGELVFAGEYSIPKVIGYSYMDVPNIDYESMTVNDPHWMISKEDAEVLVENNKIALPSRSPYFGIVPGIYLDSANLTQSIIVRVVEDEYAEYLSTGTLNKTVKLTNVKYIVSLLELYLACIYAFITYTGRTTGSSSDRYFCYDGAYSSYQDIVEIWNYYVTYRPTQRSEFPHVDERVEKIAEFYALFSRDISENFLIDSTTAGTLLNSINPELKISIDSFFTFGRGFEILSLLIKDLSDWASDNIGAAAPNMSSIILGLGSLEYVKNIIKFFKPYRARFVLITTSFIIKNPLTDSIVIGDNPFIDTLQETIIDFDTADSAPGYLEGFFPEGVAVQSDPTPPEQRIFNIYVDSTGDVRAVIEPAVTSDITQIYSDPPVDCYRVANVYLEDYGYDGMYNIVKKLYVEYYDTPETIAGVATPIYSMPPSEIQFYQSHYLKIDVLDHLVITYDETQQYLDWPIDVVERRYYSRELMDCGSWFDIGASCDFEQEHIPEIREEIHDYYNIHRYGAEVVNLEGNVDGDYTVDSTGDVNFAMQCGGFVNFDIGWLFDSPFANDICYIEVIEDELQPLPTKIWYWSPMTTTEYGGTPSWMGSIEKLDSSGNLAWIWDWNLYIAEDNIETGMTDWSESTNVSPASIDGVDPEIESGIIKKWSCISSPVYPYTNTIYSAYVINNSSISNSRLNVQRKIDGIDDYFTSVHLFNNTELINDARYLSLDTINYSGEDILYLVTISDGLRFLKSSDSGSSWSISTLNNVFYQIKYPRISITDKDHLVVAFEYKETVDDVDKVGCYISNNSGVSWEFYNIATTESIDWTITNICLSSIGSSQFGLSFKEDNNLGLGDTIANIKFVISTDNGNNWGTINTVTSMLTSTSEEFSGFDEHRCEFSFYSSTEIYMSVLRDCNEERDVINSLEIWKSINSGSSWSRIWNQAVDIPSNLEVVIEPGGNTSYESACILTKTSVSGVTNPDIIVMLYNSNYMPINLPPGWEGIRSLDFFIYIDTPPY